MLVNKSINFFSHFSDCVIIIIRSWWTEKLSFLKTNIPYFCVHDPHVSVCSTCDVWMCCGPNVGWFSWGISSQTWISASVKSVGRFWSARQPHQCLCHPRNVYIFYIFQPSVSVVPYLEKPRVPGTSRGSNCWMPLHCKQMANGGLDATSMESVFHRFGRSMHTCSLLEVT